jgi:PAS domain-containing protein
LLDDLDLRLLLDLAPSPVVLLQQADRSRPAPTITLVNRAFTEVAGLGVEALVGRSLRMLGNALEIDESFATLLTAAATGEPFAGRLNLRTAAGQALAVGARGQALPHRPDRYAIWLQVEPPSRPSACGLGPATPSGC